MKNIELLAPAGDKEALIAAIQNGANAIYLGGSMFNARAFAKNFDKEELLWAVQYAHLRNVRIFITVNTLYKDEEFEDLIEYLDYLFDIQVDALIIQDIGLFHIVRKRYPDFEIHMSTQASLMNKDAVAYFEEQGASRVVLARENTIEEIQDICSSTSLDIEVFVHGAMCVCYSGQCLMSSVIGNRSGNRGQCAQPCRLKYKFMKNNEILKEKSPYLLSPKDMMTIEHIGDLIEAGVHSFKIEGRMKRPEYVGSVVKAYRKAIDEYLHKQKSNFEDDIYQMKSMFNRDYTDGYIFHDQYIVQGDYSGNKGMIIGKVIGYKKKEKRVVIELSDTLKQGDSIVFENIDKGRPINKIFHNQKLVSNAIANNQVEIEFDYPVYQGNVRKVINIDVINNIQKTYSYENIKQPIYISFKGRIGDFATLKIQYKDECIIKKSHVLIEKAIKVSLDQERIEKQLSKLGNTVFYAKSIIVDIEPFSTMPIKEINEMRRQAIDELTQKLMSKKVHKEKNTYFPHIQCVNATSHEYHVFVSNLQQLEVLFEYDIPYIYYPYQKDALKAYQLCKNHQKEMILFIPRICKDDDIKEIKNSHVYQKVKKIVVNDFGSYHAFCDKTKILGTGINIYNSYSSSFMNEQHILSLEIQVHQLQHMKINQNQCIYQIYGKTENMISEYCPISQYYFGFQNKNCQLCHNGKYALLDRLNVKYDLMMDEQCRMHLLNDKPTFIKKVKTIPVKGLLFHFTNEETHEIENILNHYLIKNIS